MDFILLTKTSFWCDMAVNFAKLVCPQVVVVRGERGAPLPAELGAWRGDYLVSFLSSWVIPAPALGAARMAALNFHPAPPEYPGTGCYNFALYDEAPHYGVTCHHMAAQVDTGKIVKVARFPIWPNDSVASLKERSMVHLLAMFYELLGGLAQGRPLPTSPETWTRQPYTRRELDALCRITADMSDKEMKRRIRATYFAGYPGPFVELGGTRFEAGGVHV